MKTIAHHSHADVEKRLKRANGHLQKVVEMIEGGESCLNVAQQLQAVVNAISAAKKIYVQDHIEHCLEDALSSKQGKASHSIAEFKEIAKYI